MTHSIASAQPAPPKCSRCGETAAIIGRMPDGCTYVLKCDACGAHSLSLLLPTDQPTEEPCPAHLQRAPETLPWLASARQSSLFSQIRHCTHVRWFTCDLTCAASSDDAADPADLSALFVRPAEPSTTGATAPTLGLRCSWCSEVLRAPVGFVNPYHHLAWTHGMCDDCQTRFEEDAEPTPRKVVLGEVLHEHSR